MERGVRRGWGGARGGEEEVYDSFSALGREAYICICIGLGPCIEVLRGINSIHRMQHFLVRELNSYK